MSAQATGRDGATKPANEHLCAECHHVESAHKHGDHGGLGTCKLQSCKCLRFMYAAPVVERRLDQDALRELAQTPGGGVVERRGHAGDYDHPISNLLRAQAAAPVESRGPQETWSGSTPFVPASFVAPTKDTNPKDAVGTCKVPCSTVSAPVIAEVGLAMLEGARKYGRHNYRVSGVRASVYYDAVKTRHLDPWWEGEDIDPDSGLSHITKAIAGLVVLRDSMIQGNWIDDRPPPSPAGWLAELNKKAAEIVAKYPDAKEPFLATDTAEDTKRKLGK